MLKDTL